MPFDLPTFYLIDYRLIALLMIALLLLSSEIGYRLGQARESADDSLRGLMSGTGGAMLGLLGLLLGFALLMAISRWDARRDVIVHESNAIASVWLHAELLDEPFRGELQEVLRAYSKARIALGGTRGDPDALRAARRESEALHEVIWSVVQRANQPTTATAMSALVIGPAKELINLHELRLASIENHLPPTLFLLLFVVAAFSVGFLGWSFGAAPHRGRGPVLLLTLLISAILLFIMDVNRPQRGMMAVGVAPLERVVADLSAPGS